jgi:hypothetical protein
MHDEIVTVLIPAASGQTRAATTARGFPPDAIRSPADDQAAPSAPASSEGLCYPFGGAATKPITTYRNGSLSPSEVAATFRPHPRVRQCPAPGHSPSKPTSPPIYDFETLIPATFLAYDRQHIDDAHCAAAANAAARHTS